METALERFNESVPSNDRVKILTSKKRQGALLTLTAARAAGAEQHLHVDISTRAALADD